MRKEGMVMGIKDFICSKVHDCKARGSCPHSYEHALNVQPVSGESCCTMTNLFCQVIQDYAYCRHIMIGEDFPKPKITKEEKTPTHEIPGIL